MDNTKSTFNDPGGIFSIHIPSHWKYAEKKELDRESLHQFAVSDDCVFQISCNSVNSHISKIIYANKIKPHDFGLPNISFIEDCSETESNIFYTWMALIDEHFFLAAYYFNPESKDPKTIGLDLMDIRMALRYMRINSSSEAKKETDTGLPKAKDEVDLSDIKHWRNPSTKFFESITQRTLSTNRISPLDLNPLELYALLSTHISHQPNGFFDLMKVGKPLDNTIWWDFVLECDKGFIQVWRTPFILEASYYFDGDFDLVTFFSVNIQRYKENIIEAINGFERHTIYINHYQSYYECVETLWEEISKIDLSLPISPKGHFTTEDEMKKYSTEVEQFINNSVRYHALAKSLVLNAAFKVESFLNLVIRIGCLPELRLYPEVLSKFTKQDFQFRIKNIGFYTHILSGQVDMEGNIYRETKMLMTLRNKYVHYEEDTTHNRLSQTYYDRDYPLHPVNEHRPAVETVIQTFHHPDIVAVRKAYQTSNDFVSMIESLFDADLKENLLFLIKQNPIGYNETKGIYSAIYMPVSLDFFTR